MEAACRGPGRGPGQGGAVRDRFQGEGQVARRREALLRVLVQAAPDDAVQFRGDRCPRARRLRWIVMQDGREGIGGRVAREGTLTGDHLVHYAAEREEIAP